MPQAIIRHPVDSDLPVLVEIYAACFADRVLEIFGGPHRSAFIADYLRFYLAWDPANAWVYEHDNHVVAVVIAPCRYAPLKAALFRGQVFSWFWHLLTGRYGLPLHIFRLFLNSGFAFNEDAVIRELWGRPYIHLFAVAPGSQGQRFGAKLLEWTLEQFRRQAVECCWLLVQKDNHRAIKLYEKFGFRCRQLQGSGDLVMIWGDLQAAAHQHER